MRGNEFAHVHPLYDGSMHMMLPIEQVNEMIVKGWGEVHPLVPSGRMPETTVLVFGPRDEAEVEIVLGLIGVSHQFALGEGFVPKHSED